MNKGFTTKFTPFQIARIKLTLWYILITFFLLFIFSIAAINAEKNAFNRIQQVLSNRTQRPLLTALLEKRINEFEDVFRKRLFLFDVILFVISSGASYFLSGRTLRPIQNMIKQQEEFSADASHELRTPLTTIGMEIEALKRTDKNMPEEYKNVFGSIQEEVERMRKIVDGLLILVRSNYSNANKDWKIFNISELTVNTCNQMKPLTSEKHIELRSTIIDNIHIFGSQEQIKQMIIIFLDNSIKYTPAHGKVFVDLASSSRNIHLTISDTGIGISENDLPHIFERFYRAGYKTNTFEKGAGLGLSIARKIVDGHHGKITVESALDKGTSFIITLPINS